jgi:5-(carboxyamino)imidazole ribonucleotide mutase
MSVAIVMGSDSDEPVMSAAKDALEEFDIAWEMRVLSAHRSPSATLDFARAAAGRGVQAIIAGAGGAAHLPGVIAAVTPLPVIGVPIALKALDGLDSLLSIVQMPRGIPVAAVAIDNARNAGLLAVRILAVGDAALQRRVEEFQQRLAAEVTERDAQLQQRLGR